jgi:hypothetical protein
VRWCKGALFQVLRPEWASFSIKSQITNTVDLGIRGSVVPRRPLRKTDVCSGRAVLSDVLQMWDSFFPTTSPTSAKDLLPSINISYFHLLSVFFFFFFFCCTGA